MHNIGTKVFHSVLRGYSVHLFSTECAAEAHHVSVHRLVLWNIKRLSIVCIILRHMWQPVQRHSGLDTPLWRFVCVATVTVVPSVLESNQFTIAWSLSLSLSCLVTPGPSKDIQCHVWPYHILSLGLQITKSDTGPQIYSATSMVISDGYFDLQSGLQEFVCVHMG